MAGTAPTRKRGTGKTTGKVATDPGEGLTALVKPKRRRPFSSYSAAMKWLDGLTNLERLRPASWGREAPSLDRMRTLLAALGNPQDELRIVHVAGSKGKGSVCEMIAASLRTCGYTVGISTSPHLVTVRERVRIDGDPISEQDFLRALSRVRDAAQAHPKAGPGDAGVSYFEAMIAVSLLHFADAAVDAAVLEVGLGGRLDATNVVTPTICAITRIQLEHTQILGDDVAKIAAEKAGIIKKGVPTVVAPQDPDAMASIQTAAESAGAPLLRMGDELSFSVRFEATHDMPPHARVCVGLGNSMYEHLPVPIPGQHQAENCGVALGVIAKLNELGFDLPETRVAEGLASTARNGRMEMVFDEPRVMVDGAHTGESIKALVQAIGAQVKCDSMVVIFGCAADKDVDVMLGEIGRGADKVIFTKAESNPRASDPQLLCDRFTAVTGKMAQVEPTVKDAINCAARAVGRDDLICVTGSFYLAGEAKGLLDAKRRELVGA
ncbi:MAG: folylpolyglutamate synthase/dihydrofolate synthase family protein [Planctomycetota bacterium]